MSNPIIKSILDTDLYKLSMQFAVLQKFPNLKVTYRFIDRNNLVYPKGFAELLTEEVKKMEILALTFEEAKYLETIPFIPQAYIDFLKGYRFDPNEVIISQDSEGHLLIPIAGYWYRTILWEVPLMGIISELYFKVTGQTPTIEEFKDTNKLVEMSYHGAYFSDFGTRRRFSYSNQERIVALFAASKNKCFVGTSNVHLAMKYGIKPIGTMAHEWIMAHGALFGYRVANELAMENWTNVYGGDLGTALTDTYTSAVFFETFSKRAAKLFDGVRQDSYNPYLYADMAIAFYKRMGIDPMTKTIIFSNALTVTEACRIKEYCVGKIKSSFGIGTHLSNDVGVKPLNIVIKLSAVEINGKIVETVKLSDDIGKHTGNTDELELCMKTLKITMAS